jgi:hypothetical protein
VSLFKRALEQEEQSTPLVAFELAKILAKSGMVTESLVYFTKAVEISFKDATGVARSEEAIR